MTICLTEVCSIPEKQRTLTNWNAWKHPHDFISISEEKSQRSLIFFLLDHKEDWLKMQNDRQTILDSICLSKNLTNSKRKLDERVARQLFVNENYKFIYCEVPKVGCTNWKKIVLLLTLNLSRDTFEVNQGEIHKTNLLKRLSSYPSKQQAKLLNSFTKVMFTRHPLERLVSAYRDKLLHNEPYYGTTLANEIKAMFRKDNNFTVDFAWKMHCINLHLGMIALIGY
uniref:Carbohydrate sulfotransferase n=1 Tax=Pseudonaja textilis TaxID=8673 RepID=A0A670Y4E9_PSETE